MNAHGKTSSQDHTRRTIDLGQSQSLSEISYPVCPSLTGLVEYMIDRWVDVAQRSGR